MTSINVLEAIGDRETGYYVKTPIIPNRTWPGWCIGSFLVDYPLMREAFEHGYDMANPTLAHVAESQRFFKQTHHHVGGGVWVLEVNIENNPTRFFPSVYSMDRFEGNVSRWLDSLEGKIAFPEVINLQFAQMLHRRGYQLICMADDDAPDEEWIPVHVKNFDPEEIDQ